jgi:RimJ/RimL family protein N-acetyltransferase
VFDDNVSVIETERLVLRLPRLDDAEALLEFVGDEDVMRRIGDEPGGREKAEAFVARWRTPASNRLNRPGIAPSGRWRFEANDRRTIQ